MAASVGSKLKSRLTEEVARNMEAGQSNVKINWRSGKEGDNKGYTVN